jgi:hypothetical protein
LGFVYYDTRTNLIVAVPTYTPGSSLDSDATELGKICDQLLDPLVMRFIKLIFFSVFLVNTWQKSELFISYGCWVLLSTKSSDISSQFRILLA